MSEANVIVIEPEQNILPVLKFRQFRLVGDAVIVTGYTGWRKVVTHTNNGGKVALFSDLSIVKNCHVVNHKGEKLYWFTEQGFIEQPVVNYFTMVMHRLYDVDGVPTFSHLTEKSIAKSEYKHLYEPLYTNVVVQEFHKLVERIKVKQVKLLT